MLNPLYLFLLPGITPGKPYKFPGLEAEGVSCPAEPPGPSQRCSSRRSWSAVLQQDEAHTHIHTYIPTEDSTSTPSDVDLYLWSFCKNIHGKWIFFPIILQMWQKDKKQNKPKLPKGDLGVTSTYQRGDFHILQSSRLYQFSSNSNLQIQTFLCDTNITKTIVANKMENK